MCTRPDHRSVSTSAYAFARSCLAVVSCLVVLFVAIASAPVRFLRSRGEHNAHAAPVGHIDVQVHLEDAKCVAELKRAIRQTLRRAARTWAPLLLPVDRVVVGANFPPGGKVDLYASFPHAASSPRANGRARPFVVVSLGLRDGDRELETAEVSGALAAQVQAVIDDQFAQRTTIAAPPRTAASSTTASGASSPERSGRFAARPRPTASESPQSPTLTPGTDGGAGEADTSFPRLQDYLATKQQSQPLEVTGSSANGTHP